jgi:hypothetical protein
MGKGGLGDVSAWCVRAGTMHASMLQRSRGLSVTNGIMAQMRRWEACPDTAVRAELDGMPLLRWPHGGKSAPSCGKAIRSTWRTSGRLSA